MVIMLKADMSAIQMIPTIAHSYITNLVTFITFNLIGQKYDKEIVDWLQEVASPSGAGLTFTLCLGLSNQFFFDIL